MLSGPSRVRLGDLQLRLAIHVLSHDTERKRLAKEQEMRAAKRRRFTPLEVARCLQAKDVDITPLDDLVWKAAVAHAQHVMEPGAFYMSRPAPGISLQNMSERLRRGLDMPALDDVPDPPEVQPLPALLDQEDCALAALADAVDGPVENLDADVALASAQLLPVFEIPTSDPSYSLPSIGARGNAIDIVDAATIRNLPSKSGGSPGFVFRAVQCRPPRIKVPCIDDVGSALPSEIAITLHKVVSVDAENHCLHIDIDSVKPRGIIDSVCLWQPPVGLNRMQWNALLFEFKRDTDPSGTRFLAVDKTLSSDPGSVLHSTCIRLVNADAFPSGMCVSLSYLSVRHSDVERATLECLENAF